MTNSTKVWFIADLLLEDVPQGGAELVNRQLVQMLSDTGVNISEVYSFKISPAFLKAHKDDFFILAGFINMPTVSLEFMQNNIQYLLYEHDHKYVINRNPADYEGFKIPLQQLVYQDVYKNAQAVVCQSELHENILKLNMPEIVTHNMGGSLWTEETLDKFKSLNNQGIIRTNKCAIIRSDNHIKGQPIAEKYCKDNNLEYDLISAPNSLGLYRKLLEYDKLIYFPTSPETFSRVFMEAKLAGCKIICNKLIGALSEPYSWNDEEKLFEEVLSKRNTTRDYILEKIRNHRTNNKEENLNPEKPMVSILTSVYNGEKYLNTFLEDITRQTCFSKCELILVDCNTEECSDYSIIEPYLEKYQNIKYHKLPEDPGVYGAWNHAIENSNGEFITNANLDDRRSYENIETLTNELKNNPDIDLVYSPFISTNKEGENFYTSNSKTVYETYEFSPANMVKCLPGCMPVWRRNLHTENGLFDDSYRSAGDWEFWLRCVKNGSKFKRVNIVMGLYYFNPTGLSTSLENHDWKTKEEQRVIDLYGEFLTSEKSNSI